MKELNRRLRDGIAIPTEVLLMVVSEERGSEVESPGSGDDFAKAACDVNPTDGRSYWNVSRRLSLLTVRE